jgi:hypothetical protein
MLCYATCYVEECWIVTSSWPESKMPLFLLAVAVQVQSNTVTENPKRSDLLDSM